MILSSEYVLRAIELRVKTVPIIGTLCSIKDPATIWNAMDYFQCYSHGQYVSQPFIELDQDIYNNMDLAMFKIYAEMLIHYMPPCTVDEIHNTIYLSKKFNYQVTVHKDRMSLRRIKNVTNSTRYRDRPYREN